MSNLLSVKALEPADRSDAILVSFDADWLSAISEKRINAVVRKRMPSEPGVRWLYFYVNAPHSIIPARAPVKRIREVPIEEAIRRAKALSLTKEQIQQYAGRLKALGLYEIGKIEVAREALSMAWLRKRAVFFPPQSFLFLSRSAKRLIDEHGGFR